MVLSEMKQVLRACIFCVALWSGLEAQAQIPAFPGAEGFGAYASGGRGGDVYIVTSLANNGAGTLRDALNTVPPEGRTIVFAVSGYIPVVSDTNFQVPANVTIAGQTAPGDGVGLQGGRMLISGNNTIMRHFRIRHGKGGTGGDCLNIASGVDNTMLDHISMMFSTDENFSFFGGYPDDFTMQYSSSSWGMERHNAGGLWDLEDGTCHHSLWAHHRTRNPKARPGGVLEWINNVTFHWRNEPFIMGDSESPANWKANIRGCYYISIDDPDEGFGLKNTGMVKAHVSSAGVPNFSLYLDQTLFDNNGNGMVDGTDRGYDIVAGSEFSPGDPVGSDRYYKATAPFQGATGAAEVSVDDPLTAYKKVISSVGPLRLDANYAGPLRDELDALLIDSVTNQYSILVQKDGKTAVEDPNRTNNGEKLLADQFGISNYGFGTLQSTEAPEDTDRDGMPDYWENALGWSATVQDHNTPMASSGGVVTGTTFFPENTPAGYTRLEEYLHFKAIPHATMAVNGTLEVDLRRYTDGFANTPVFTLSNSVNGTAELLADGFTARFSPTADFSGRCRFEFTVTDADGSSWTQTLGLIASNAFIPPSAPADLQATPTSSHQIDLQWTDQADNESGYIIERSADGINFSEVAVTEANATSYTDNALSPNATYQYRIRAFNGVAESSYSSTVSATTPTGAPSAPSGVMTVPASGQVTLQWEASAGASNYVIKRALTAAGPFAIVSTNATTTYVDAGLSNLTTYFYAVSALNTYGESEASDVVSAMPRLSIQINAGGAGVSPYEADAYFSGGGSWSNDDGINTSGVVDPAPASVYQTEHNGNFTYTFSGLTAGQDYLVRLHFAEIYHTSSGSRLFDVSINGSQVLNDFDVYAAAGGRFKALVREFTVAANASGALAIGFVTVKDNAKVSAIEVLNAAEPPQVVASPSNQSVVAGESALFAVQATGNPPPTYQWMKDGVALAGQTGAILTIPSVLATDQGLYSVYLQNRFGVVFSESAALAVGEPGDLPTGLFAVPGNSQVALHWAGVGGAAGYTVKRATSSGGPYEMLSAVPEPNFTDFFVQNGATYYYVVQTESGSSVEVSATPSAASGGQTIQVEAVSVDVGGGVALESNNSGFHVASFANFPSSDGYLQFNDVDGGTGGSATLTVRFALGSSARTGRLIVNGSTSSITFPGTGGWSTWSTMNVPVTLNAGAVNTIRIESTGSDLGNVDEITVVPTINYSNSSSADLDADGLVDAWEQTMLGSMNYSGNDDPDQDGLSISTELAYGLGPQVFDPVRLDVVQSNRTIRMEWPDYATGWQLEYTTSLATDSWTPINSSLLTNAHDVDPLGITLQSQFYRLIH